MKYKIIVNGTPKKDECHIYKFDYGSVKNIELILNKGHRITNNHKIKNTSSNY